MLFQYNHSFGFLSITALVAILVAIAAWRRRRASTASISFASLMLAVAGYATVAALEAAAIALPDKIFWSTLEYVGSGSVMTLFLVFALHFTNQQHWLTLRRVLLLCLLPGLNVVLVATNQFHYLVWTGFLLNSETHQAIYRHGPGFYWAILCIYAYALAGFLLLIRSTRKAQRLQRQQSKMALAGTLMPLLAVSAYALGLTPPGLNVTPMSFLATGLIYFVMLFRFRLFDLVPVARDVLVDRMTDGVLVLDGQNRIVDFNPAAQRLVGQLNLWPGQALKQVFAHQSEILQLCQLAEPVEIQLRWQEGATRYVALQMIPLYEQRQPLTGRLLILRDVTQQQRTEKNLRQLNGQLQIQLQEIQTLQAQLREQAIRDSLTGLFNRRYFEETLVRELARAIQSSYPIAIILMDVDFFKKINDTYGHPGGDRVLQELGLLLQRHSRPGDIACRYGGEEFVWTLPGVPLRDAYQRAEEIRHAFESLKIETPTATISATLSLGISLFPDQGQTLEALLHASDQALYLAKAEGRNCIRACIKSC